MCVTLESDGLSVDEVVTPTLGAINVASLLPEDVKILTLQSHPRSTGVLVAATTHGLAVLCLQGVGSMNRGSRYVTHAEWDVRALTRADIPLNQPPQPSTLHRPMAALNGDVITLGHLTSEDGHPHLTPSHTCKLQSVPPLNITLFPNNGSFQLTAANFTPRLMLSPLTAKYLLVFWPFAQVYQVQ